jgi:hypothetical protein
MTERVTAFIDGLNQQRLRPIQVDRAYRVLDASHPGCSSFQVVRACRVLDAEVASHSGCSSLPSIGCRGCVPFRLFELAEHWMLSASLFTIVNEIPFDNEISFDNEIPFDNDSTDTCHCRHNVTVDTMSLSTQCHCRHNVTVDTMSLSTQYHCRKLVQNKTRRFD